MDALSEVNKKERKNERGEAASLVGGYDGPATREQKDDDLVPHGPFTRGTSNGDARSSSCSLSFFTSCFDSPRVYHPALPPRARRAARKDTPMMMINRPTFVSR